MGIYSEQNGSFRYNILILFHMIFVNIKLYNVLSNKSDTIEIKNVIANYLPVYFLWTFIVVFIFPIIFGF